MLTTREAILLKVEGTKNVDANPDPAVDALLVSDLSYANDKLRMLERNNIKPTLSTDQKIFAGTMKKVSFTAELKGSGTAGTPPEVAQALRCCGLSEVIGASEVTYQPVSTNHETCTIYYHQEGVLHKITGAMGNVTLNASGDNFGTLQFEFTGHDGGKVDQNIPTITYANTVPRPFINIAFSVGSYPAIINALTLNAGNEIVVDPDVSKQWGFGDVRISKRDPNGTIDPLATTKAVNDFDADFKAGNLLPLTTGPVGSEAGNRWQADATIAIREMSPGEREGSRTDDVTYGCHETTTDDEWKLIFS